MTKFPTVRAAVEPLKGAAMERARIEAVDYINRLLQRIEYAGGNLDILAPYPDSTRCDRTRYATMQRRRQTYEMICDTRSEDFGRFDATKRRHTGPYEARYFNYSWHFLTPNADRITHFIDSTVEAAGVAYDAFVAKLDSKIGKVDEVELEGSHVWGYSHLFVTKPNGTKEIWKTQQIVNQSVLGLLFNQWPSRKVKRA